MHPCLVLTGERWSLVVEGGGGARAAQPGIKEKRLKERKKHDDNGIKTSADKKMKMSRLHTGLQRECVDVTNQHSAPHQDRTDGESTRIVPLK